MPRPRSKARTALLRVETGTVIKSGAQLRVCLVFPNKYALGMSNLGFQTIYRELNSRPDTVCERGFLDPGPGFDSIETGRRFDQFDVIAFSVSFELDFLGLAKVLHESGLPLLAQDRDASHPLVVMGALALSQILNLSPTFSTSSSQGKANAPRTFLPINSCSTAAATE